MANSALARIASAQAHVGGQYAKNGRYLLKVQSIRTRDGTKGFSIKAELKVIRAEATQPNESPSSVGSVIDYVENLTDPKKGGGSRFKGFIMQLLGAAEHELANPDTLTKFEDDRQAAVGLLIECEAYPKNLPPKDGKPAFTVTGMRWGHVEMTDAQLAEADAERAALGLKPLAEVLAG